MRSAVLSSRKVVTIVALLSMPANFSFRFVQRCATFNEAKWRLRDHVVRDKAVTVFVNMMTAAFNPSAGLDRFNLTEDRIRERSNRRAAVGLI
ncbi:hypothetical protein [Bradyrhizobium sp. NBAIM08]|uniref:hypothetical protein n=1 Tax=Bradyrhizobium sp. NBAIM08 TaxID=2793815 RepID=UPI001CD5142F|nr:hypothetical protein [Bradyrhizobium sp. NBAIM08]MCA1479843.1 hypothetical protein [Bradyrhizobium sp. NBAIM08]